MFQVQFFIIILSCSTVCLAHVSISQLNVTAIKGNRDKVPAGEIMSLLKPYLAAYEESIADDILKLISNLGYSSSSTGKTYYLIQNGVTWIDAYTNCVRTNKEFATVTSDEEQLQIVEMMVAAGTQDAWIGGNEVEKDGSWVWVGGRCTKSIEDYTYWESGQPDSKQGNEHCLGVRMLGWNDYGCTNDALRGSNLLFPYFCQSKT